MTDKQDSTKKAVVKRKQTSHEEIKRRINQIVRMIIAGFTSLSHVHELNKKEGWDLSESQLVRYLNRARKQIRENGFFFESKKDVASMSFHWLMDILQNANKNKDNDLKLKVIREINKMFDVYGIEILTERETKKNNKHTLSDDEIMKRLNIE